MAQRVRVEYIDDLDGSIAQGTVPFAVDGVSYEIDLSEENAEELRTILTPYMQAGRRVAGRRARGRATGADNGQRREQLEKVRTWARENGYQVRSRGRIAAKIQQAYDAAH